MTITLTAHRRRPAGVTLLSTLATVGAMVSLAAGLAIAAAGDVEAGLGAAGVYVAGAEVTAAYLLLMGTFQLILAWGWWSLRPWAWALGVLAQAVGVIGTVLAGAARCIEVGHAVFAIVIHGAILAYLLSPSVRRAFTRQDMTDATLSQRQPQLQ